MDSTSPKPAHFSLDEAAELILNYLKSYTAWSRGPPQLRASWERLRSAQNDDFLKLIRDNGNRASWFAVLITQSVTVQENSRFQGKADCRRFFEHVQGLSSEARAKLASQLAPRIARLIPSDLGAQIDELFRKRIESTQDSSMLGNPHKRRRPLDEPNQLTHANTPLDDLISQTSPTTEQVDEPLPTTGVTPDPTPSGEDFRRSMLQHTQVFVNASLQAAMRLFPSESGDAIMTRPHPTDPNKEVAAIDMAFPNALFNQQIQCQMSIEILPQKAPDLIRTMFGARVETVAGLRYVALAGGAEVVPDPRLVLRGCGRDTILSLYGNKISEAIATSPAYLLDDRRHRSRTGSVWAVITSNGMDSIVINLSLGLVEGTKIREMLYV